MFGKSIWGLCWINCIGAVSLRTFRILPVSYRPTNAAYSLSSSDNKRPTTHHDDRGARYPPHCYNCCTHCDGQTYTEHSCPGNKPSPPATQTLQSATNITCKIFIFVDPSHEYLPTHVMLAFLTETRVPVWKFNSL
jgi:hypothetical protein